MSYNNRNNYGNYDSRANRIAAGILIIIISVIACLSLFNWMGGVGRMISSFLIGVFGLVSYAYAICGVILGIMVTIGKRITLPATKAIVYFAMFSIGVLIFHVAFSKNSFINHTYAYYLNATYAGETAAGWVGSVFAWMFMKVFTPAYALVVLILLFAGVSIFAFYPLLQTKLPYRTKRTKIRANKGKAPVLTDISSEGSEERIVASPVGNSLFVGTLDEKSAAPEFKAATKRDKGADFNMLFPNQDTLGVTEDSMVEPVFDSAADRKKRAKEALFGSKKNKTNQISEPEQPAVDFGKAVSAKSTDDIKPSLKKEPFTFRTDLVDNKADDGIKRPRSINDAFELPQDEESKVKDIRERFGYILDSEVTPHDIKGAPTNKIVEPKRKKPEPEPEPEIMPEDNKKSEGDMPYFIKNILYGDSQSKTEKEVAKPAADINEEVVTPSIKPVEEPKIIQSIIHNAEPKPAEKKDEPKPDTEAKGSIFDMGIFGARPRTPKPAPVAEPIAPVTQPNPEPIVKQHDDFSRPINSIEEGRTFKTVENIIKSDNNGTNSDAVMPSEAEIKKVAEKPVEPKPALQPKYRDEHEQQSSYENNFPVGRGVKPVTVTPAEVKKPKPQQISIEQAIIAQHQRKPYMAPPIDLLKKLDTTIVAENFDEQIEIVERTFSEFRIDAKVIGVTQGPTFSRFELQMPIGVPVSTVTKYADDISMKLEAKDSIRFETPIPGKNAFGIEIANKKRTPVGLRSVLEDAAFNSSKSILTFALGRDIGNENYVCDIETMPHMLIAGSTGSGKSVCINALIISLLYRCGPNDLKLILIDPKKVELSLYNGLPHMLVPEVIDDVAAAVNALDWAISEMNKRYNLFKDNAVRNIFEYNELAKKTDGMNTLPRIIIIFDELADFMAKMKRQVEDKINSLTRLARAAGIHVIVATQRPSVDVITGTIKSNLPSRIAFAVTSTADSMTIMGGGGAEKLLGKGDMLYYPQSLKTPLRLQCAYVDGDEVRGVVNYIKAHNESYFDPEAQNSIFRVEEPEPDEAEPVSYTHSAVGKNGESQLFIDALKMCVTEQQASISKIQRKFNVGYGTAANIIDQMEEKRYVSANKGGNKTRDVLISLEQFYELYGRGDDIEGFDGQN